MAQPPIGMATLARYYDASGAQKVSIVRDARMFEADPKLYERRDFYANLRNTLRDAHWKSDDISVFADALAHLLTQQDNPSKQEHFEKIGTGYINYWEREDPVLFTVASMRIEIAGLPIRITPDFGMRHGGDNFAVKLWLASPRPKRTFRQAIQYLMAQAQREGWRTDLQPVLLDVRREALLQPVPLPKDFAWAIEAQAAAFRYMWDSIGP